MTHIKVQLLNSLKRVHPVGQKSPNLPHPGALLGAAFQNRFQSYTIHTPISLAVVHEPYFAEIKLDPTYFIFSR
jgi:hypothetical protein